MACRRKEPAWDAPDAAWAGGPGLCNVPGTAAGDPHAWPWQGARQTLLAQFLQRLAHRCATRVEFLDDHAIVDGGA
ncbi:hypothetical protein B5M06_10005 [Comamonas kerstersii]|uniref:Uncharacterized protein n=1 Tax=Comamonas kerstersii TaxID=225992 RepID=A0A1V0BF05_9BURK|nr:hypothetical protein B5M06_10005 [Comamonas kerstersii]